MRPLSEYSVFVYLPAISLQTRMIYWVLLGFFCLGLICLPVIRVDLSVRAAGVVRPEQERVELKPLTNAIIRQILYNEGDLVPRDSPVVLLYETYTGTKANRLQYELKQRKLMIRDLQRIIANADLFDTSDFQSVLSTEVYQREWLLFLTKRGEFQSRLDKMQEELGLHSELYRERVISTIEFKNMEFELARMRDEFEYFKDAKIQEWQRQLMNFQSEVIQYQLDWQHLHYDQEMFELRAPVSGRIMGLTNRYAGAKVQAGEVLAILTPEASLLAEITVPVRDIGLIKVGQKVRYQIEAFDYKYFGTLNGRVVRIDPDYSLLGDQPYFKVWADFESVCLNLSNGFEAEIKKGMTLQAGFILTRRSLWQLLYDDIDDWLNPNAVASNILQ